MIFIPAALTRTYGLFLTGLFVQGAGLSLLQTASNPYVTILGPIESAARRMSIMGVANKVAGIISPLILGAIVLKNADSIEQSLINMTIVEKAATLDQLSQRVILPYIIMSGVLIVLAILIRYSALPKINEQKNETASHTNTNHSIFSYTYLWLGILALFFYVGVEVIAVDTIITYGKSIGFEISKARFFASFTLFGMIAGYLLGIITIPKFISQSKALAIMAVLGVIFTLLGVVTEGMMSIISIALLGFANAIMWPAIWPLSINGLGKHTKLGSAFLIMAIAGGAILPLVYGALSDLPHIGTQTAYLIMVPCYLFIMFFAAKGHKIGQKQT
jgi:glucose/galactose transporter